MIKLMGSPLAPVLANLFMGHFENIWLTNFRSCKILFDRRYVDDIFCLFNSESDGSLFTILLNHNILRLILLWNQKVAAVYLF